MWLGNNRGSTFSRKHKTLDPDHSRLFWEFSFQELGEFDDVAMIDFVRK